MKGYKLMRMIAKDKIKNGTLFKINNWESIFVYSLGSIKNRDTGDYLTNIIILEGIAKADFKIIKNI